MKQANIRRIKKECIKRNHVKKHEKSIKILMFSRITCKKEENEHRIAKRCYKKKKKTSISSCRNHCVISGRAHSIYSDFKLARNEMKRFAHKGLLFGVKKAS
jgi:ribosomal protein S14